MAGITFRGAARLDPAGAFELHLGDGKTTPRMQCISEPLRHYIREMYDFLMSPEPQRVVGEYTLLKRRGGSGKPYVHMNFLDGFVIRLVRGEGEYASFFFGIPFAGATEDLELSLSLDSGAEGDSEDWTGPDGDTAWGS